jgi:putative ABC transport system permease protein
MLRLFRAVSLREHRAHVGRALLIVAGVATGIALMVAFDVMNASVITGFRQTFTALAGPADLEVTLGVGEVGFPEDVADVVRRDPDVALVVPLVRGTVVLGDDASEPVQLFGAELTAEDDLARYGVRLTTDRRAALQALNDPHAVLVAETLATRLRLDVGSTVRLATPRGRDTFTIRGLLASDGVARILGGQLVVMDLAAAQTELVKQDRVDQLDVVLRAGADASTVQARLEAALPRTLTIGIPTARAGRYEEILASLQTTLMGISMLCVLAGLFIVYNATATGVMQRLPTVGALRLLGGNASQLRWLLVTEAAVLGACGAVAGVLLGILLARVLLAFVGTVLGTMVQMRFFVPELTVAPSHAAIAGIVGIVVAVAAAWMPARRAARLDPLTVARGSPEIAERLPTRTLAIAGVALIVLSVAVLVAGEHWRIAAFDAAGSSLFNTAGLVAGMLATSRLGGLVRRTLPRLFGVSGTVAAANVARAPVRGGVTVAAIGLVAGIAVTLVTVTASYLATADQFVRELHDGDLTVSAVATEGGWLETPLAPSVADEIAHIPGVRRVETARVVSGQAYRGWRVGLLVLEPDRLARLGPALWRDGDRLRARDALAAGDAVAVSTSFADRFRVRVGDQLDLETPRGIHALPIAGLILDLTSNSGAIILSRSLYGAWWGDPTITRVNVYLEPGVDVQEARSRLTAQLGERHLLKVLTLRDNIAYHEDKIRRAFAFVDALQILVGIVTVAGIFDLLVSGIIERRRELAVWRLIGATEWSVRHTVVIESMTLGALAVVLGLVLGLVTSWMWVRVIIPRLIGYELTFAFAGVRSAGSLAVVLLMTVAAGWAAATRATRRPVLEDIRDQ